MGNRCSSKLNNSSSKHQLSTKCMSDQDCQKSFGDNQHLVKGCSNSKLSNEYACPVEKCLEINCQKHRCFWSGLTLPQKKEHDTDDHKKECIFEGCQKVTRTPKDNFCNNHVCQYQGSRLHQRKKDRICRTGVIDKHTYCRSHRCGVTNCELQICNRKPRISSFCQDHTCGDFYCIKRVDDPFCHKHTCKIEKCTNERAFGDCYCIYHDDTPCKSCHKEDRFMEYCKNCMNQGFGLSKSESQDESW